MVLRSQPRPPMIVNSRQVVNQENVFVIISNPVAIKLDLMLGYYCVMFIIAQESKESIEDRSFTILSSIFFFSLSSERIQFSLKQSFVHEIITPILTVKQNVSQKCCIFFLKPKTVYLDSRAIIDIIQSVKIIYSSTEFYMY